MIKNPEQLHKELPEKLLNAALSFEGITKGRLSYSSEFYDQDMNEKTMYCEVGESYVNDMDFAPIEIIKVLAQSEYFTLIIDGKTVASW